MPDNIFNQIKNLSKKYFPELVLLRRKLHQYPELAYQEFQTSKTVAGELKKLGLEVKTGVAKTGVVGLIRGKQKGKTVALRSDMDALPLEEKSGVPFASKNPGKMHACGHDMHMSTLIGVAKVLTQLQDRLKGNVKFIFQPSEEVEPGGAYFMIKEKVLENPKVEAIFGLHVDTSIPTGKIGLKDGPMMAQADDFDIRIYGKGGHASRPHEGTDAVLLASQVVSALQTIASRRINPLLPVVISIGIIQGGTARNILCDEVLLKGTARSLNLEVSRKIPTLIKEVVSGIVNSAGGRYELRYNKGYPVLVNHKAINDLYRMVIKRLYGVKAIKELDTPVMGGEDFVYFLQKIPGAMFRLGVRNTKIGAVHSWHSAYFKVDENALRTGVSVMAGAVWEFLHQ